MINMTRLALLVVLLATAGTVVARPLYDDVALDVRFGVQRETGELHYDDGRETEISHTRIEATLYQTGLRWFQPGLYLATGWTSLDGDPATDGLDPAGESLGLRLLSEVPFGAGLTWVGRGAYTYHGLDDEAGGTTLELKWYELDLRTGLAWTMERIVLSGGGYYLDIDGEEQISGDVSRTRDFGLDEHVGVWAGLGVRVEPAGRVQLYVQTGPRASVGVRFARRF